MTATNAWGQASPHLSISADRFTGPRPPQRYNIARDTIGQAASAAPDKSALIVVSSPAPNSPLETWTFHDIDRSIRKLGWQLQHRGITAGDRVLIQLPNTPSYAFMVFACFAIGAIAIPISEHLTAHEIDGLIDDATPHAIALAAGDNAPQHHMTTIVITEAEINQVLADRTAPLADYADTAADDPAFLVYTSGTTAQPKGVLHAHRSAWGRRPMIDDWYGMTPSDRMLHAGSFNWTFTLGTGLTDPWSIGATAIINTGPKTPDVWGPILQRTRATLFAAVPGLIRQILKYAPPATATLPDLRHGLIAGDTPPPDLFDDWHAATGTHLYEALGMSEISTYISTSPGIPRTPGAIGRPQSGRAVAILPDDATSLTPLPRGDVGLLAVHRSDPGLMLGYWNREGEERDVFRGNWFIGGDLAHMDGTGTIFHHGRGNDIMKPGGYRVAPQEVEAALALHPDVQEAACTDIEVTPGVRVIAAFIVPRDQTAPPSEASLLEHATSQLAVYKRPRIIHIVEALPRTPNGKLTRASLRGLTP